MHANAPDQKIDQILHVPGILPEYQVRIGKYFEGTAVRYYLENRVPIRPGDDHLLHLHHAAFDERDRHHIFKYRDLPGHRQNFSGVLAGV